MFARREMTVVTHTPRLKRPTVSVKAHVMPGHYVFYNAAVTDPRDSEPRLCYLQQHRGLCGFSWNWAINSARESDREREKDSFRKTERDIKPKNMQRLAKAP